MVRSSASYRGEKHCRVTHEPSGSVIETDAPVDNNGRGLLFSPTDLIAASLSSCILTTMAIAAERAGISIAGATADVTKEMQTQPRRIATLAVVVRVPASVPPDFRAKLEFAATVCPVHQSMHPDIDIPIDFIYE